MMGELLQILLLKKTLTKGNNEEDTFVCLSRRYKYKYTFAELIA
jgi:hypothetical protein